MQEQQRVGVESPPSAARIGATRYAVRALRGSFTLNLPISAQVRRDFRLDTIAALLFGVFNGSVISYIYVVGRTIGVSPFGISVLVAMPAVGAILAMPISLTMPSAYARAFMLSAWTAGRAVVLLALLFSSPLPYTIIMALFLVSTSIASPYYAAVVQHIYPREFRGRLMSLVRIGSGAVTTVTSLMVAWLLGSAHLSYTVVFAVGALSALISLPIFARITPVRPPPRPRQSMLGAFAILRENRRFATYQAGLFAMGFGNIMTATIYPLVVVDKLHAGYGPFGVLTVVGALGYLISFFRWGRVVDRKGPLYTMYLLGIFSIVQPLCLLLAPSVWWLLPVAVASGINLAGFEIGIFSAVIYYAPAHDVPRYMALHSNFAGIRGLTAPFLAITILGAHRYLPSLGGAFVIALIGTAMLWNGARREGTPGDLKGS